MSQFKFKTTLVRGSALGIPIAVISVCIYQNSRRHRKINKSCGRGNWDTAPFGRDDINDSCS